MINYVFSPHLQQETRPFVSSFPLGCCDHSTLWVTVITAASWNETLTVTCLFVAGFAIGFLEPWQTESTSTCFLLWKNWGGLLYLRSVTTCCTNETSSLEMQWTIYLSTNVSSCRQWCTLHTPFGLVDGLFSFLCWLNFQGFVCLCEGFGEGNKGVCSREIVR
jgi:hypothetical protein